MPSILSQHTIAQPTVFRIPPPSLSLFTLLAILSIWPALTLAEVRVVTAQGEHRMGDRDTREEAIRLATEAAKRNALEQVAVYLESITIVDGLDVTKDEIRTYTAGLVLVLEQKTNTTLDENKCAKLSAPCGRTRMPGGNSSNCNRKTTNYNRISMQQPRPWHKPRLQSKHSKQRSNAKTS
jgi:hypothetical protein